MSEQAGAASTPNDKPNGLDWCRENRENVENLANSDREMAKYAQAILDYIDDEVAEFGLLQSGPTLLTRADAEQAARKVRDALADAESNGGEE